MAQVLKYKDRAEWLAMRQMGIGGSDAAAVLGLNPYRTPLDVYLDKRGEAEPDDLSDNAAVQWGIKLEDLIAQEYADRTGYKVRRVNHILRHPQHDWMLANLDRDVVGGERILECKTAGAFMVDQWGESGTDAVPMAYLYQCMHYLAVTGRDICDLAVLIGGRDFRIYTIRRDNELIEMMMLREAIFWQRVLDGEPPPPMLASDFDKLYPDGDTGLTVEADDETASRVAALQDVKAELKRISEAKDALELQIKTAIGDASAIEYGGKVIATWKSSQRAGYTVEPKTVRTLRIKN